VVLPVGGIGRFGDQLQVGDILADRASLLMSEQQTSERSALPLPIAGQDMEPNVLSENHTAEGLGAIEQFVVPQPSATIFGGGDHSDATPPKLVRNRAGHVDVHVQRHGHSSNPLRP
jgi:hypothetical protein